MEKSKYGGVYTSWYCRASVFARGSSELGMLFGSQVDKFCLILAAYPIGKFSRKTGKGVNPVFSLMLLILQKSWLVMHVKLSG